MLFYVTKDSNAWQRPLNSGWTCSWHLSLHISWFAHGNLYDDANSPNIDIPHGGKRPKLALTKDLVHKVVHVLMLLVVTIRGWPRIGTNVHWNNLYWIIGRLLHVIFLLVETWPVKVATRGHSGLRNVKGQYTFILILDQCMHSWL